MDRESFLARVRASLDEAPEPLPPRPTPYVPPPPPELADRVRMLCTELEAAGGFTTRVATTGEARQRVLEILRNRQVHRLLRGDTPALRTLAIDEELGRIHIDLTVARLTDKTTPEELRTIAFEVDAGLTSVDFAVAETGTLALIAAPGQGRAVSLLPPLHIAVLEARDVVHELAALFEQVQARGGLPSALTFITGPSKTGDIEQKLTVGVHGPGELHLVVIERD